MQPAERVLRRGLRCSAGVQSGIKNVPEGLETLYSMEATECVATGADWMAGTTTRGRMMRRIRNQGGSKTGRRKPPSGRRTDSPHEPVYVMTITQTKTGINRPIDEGAGDSLAPLINDN